MPPERPLQRKPPDSPSTKAKPLQGCPIVTTKSSVSMPYSILQNARDERSPREEAHSPRNVALQRDFASVPAIDKSTDFVPKKRPLDGSSIPSPKTSPSTGPSSHSPPFVAAQKPQFTVRAARSTIFCPSGSTLTNGFSSPRGSGAKATGFNMSATLRPTSFTEMTREESIESLKAFSTNDFHGGAAHRKTRPKSYFLGYSRRSVIIGGGGTQGGLNASQGRNSNGDMVFYVKTYECVNLRDLRRSAWGGRPRDTMLYSKARGTRCEIFLSDDPDNDIKAHETTSAELELVLAMSDSKTCFIIKFDEPIGVEFPSEEKAESFRNDLASKLKRIEEIDKMKGPTKFFEIYEKTLQPPLTVLQDPKVAKSTPQDAEQAEATTAKFAVLPPVATFGSNGNEIEVGYNLHQDIRVVNGGSKALSFTLELPQFCNRFIASANTFEATVPSGSTCTIRVRLIPLCTTVISDAIKLSITPGRGKQVDTNVHIDVRVKESCFIDDDTLEFDTLVGEGSFGTVAKGTRNGDVVAIKSLRNVDDKQVREDFLRELALLDSLRNLHVMELYGVDINPGNISIVLEYFSLGSLENVMRDYGLTLRMKYRMLKDIAEGMQFLHAMGVVHRDIKPDNILVSDLSYNATITCKIADLGSARTIFNKLEIKQTNGLGTPLYMAPEIISSASTYAKTADVYSFAILAAEVLNEKKPYSECAFPSSWALVNHVMSGKRPVILNEDLIHTCVLDLISECWEKDPNLRPCK